MCSLLSITANFRIIIFKMHRHCNSHRGKNDVSRKERQDEILSLKSQCVVLREQRPATAEPVRLLLVRTWYTGGQLGDQSRQRAHRYHLLRRPRFTVGAVCVKLTSDSPIDAAAWWTLRRDSPCLYTKYIRVTQHQYLGRPVLGAFTIPVPPRLSNLCASR